MTSLAERLAPHMAAALEHPGDNDTEPFLLPAPPMFKTAQLPPGMAEEMAEQAGLPSPDFARLYCEAWLHLVENVGDVSIVDNAELDDLRAAAASVETKRVRHIELVCTCGVTLGRLSVRNFDTERAEVNGEQLIKALSAMDPTCRHGR